MSARVDIGRVVVSELGDPVDAVALERALPGELSRALGDLDIESLAEVRSVAVQLPSTETNAGSLAEAVAAALSRTGAGA